jgi:HD-GYP domain-containing protein (c-di-GMP phosphodiesterase class II)
MNSEKRTASIFSQKLDRIVFTAYFLGAVVPLLALAFVAERFALDAVTDRLAWLGLIALILSIGSLSLGSFFVLRRTTRQTLERMDADNERLTSLLDASGSFANAQIGAEAAATAVRCGLELAAADAVYAFVRNDRSRPPEVVESLGRNAEKRLQRLAEPISSLVQLVMEEKRPVLRGASDDESWGETAAAAVPLACEATTMGALVAIRSGSNAEFSPSHVDALTTLAALASVSMHNADLRDAQRNFFSHMTELVVTALDAHLTQQSGHGNRVAQYANRVGRQMNLGEEQLQRLHFSSLLHDIGMLKLERNLLTNARACEKHPQIGARMLERIRLWEDIAPIVLHHHESFDGTGYPERLEGEAIPLEARIIAVCEAFDVMVSSSSYKVAMDTAEAVQEIKSCAGSQFDPKIVAIFSDLVESGVIESSQG